MADRATRTPTPPSALVGGRYRLIERLRSGGMGSVWAGVDERLGRRVAIKLLHEHLADDDAFVERFRREARHAAAVEHPNVVRVLDSGMDDDRPFIVMELVEGHSLREELADSGALSAERTRDVGGRLLDALAAVHGAGIVHRDVKPANVLLASDGTVKLTDLGIAKAMTEHTLTRTGEVLGTPPYLAPEVLDGAPATERSDLYAVGCILYECLAGRPPFESAGRSVPPAPVGRHDVDPALERTIVRALRRDPAERFPSAVAMREALEGPSTTVLPARSRPRRSVSRIGIRVVALVAACAALAVAWLTASSILGAGTRSPVSGTAATASASSSPAPQPTPTVLVTGGLGPGVYASSKFDPRVTFRIGAGWVVAGEDASALVLRHVQTNGFLTFARLDAVFDADGSMQPKPADLLSWLRGRNGIRVGAATAVTIGGVTGRQADVVIGEQNDCTAGCANLFRAGEGTLVVRPGEIVRVIDLDNDVTIAMDADAPQFDAFAAQASPVLTSVRFG